MSSILHATYQPYLKQNRSPLEVLQQEPLTDNANKYSFFPRSMNIWNRLPCSAASHVTPYVDNFHKFAIPAIRVKQTLYGDALIYITYEGDVF